MKSFIGVGKKWAENNFEDNTIHAYDMDSKSSWIVKKKNDIESLGINTITYIEI